MNYPETATRYNDTVPDPCANFNGRSLSVEPLNKGYVVRVGCQTVAIESKERLIELVTMYLRNPTETETLYNEGKLFKQ